MQYVGSRSSPPSTMKRVLVTGAAGFVGRHVTRLLGQMPVEVFALVRPGTPGAPLGGEAAVRRVFADLGDADSVVAAIDLVQPDTVIHLAWRVGPRGWTRSVSENLASLEAGTRLLRLLCDAGCGRIVLAGSGVEDLQGAQWHKRCPATVYAAAKRGLHQVAESLAANGASVVCAHLFYLYGPGEDDRRVVPYVVSSLLRGEYADVTDGAQRRDYLHVADAAAGLITVAASNVTATIDIASGEPTEQRLVLQAMADEVGRPELLRLGARPYEPDELTYHVGDSSALRLLGWRPTHALRTGARDTVSWWRQQVEAPT